MKLNRYFIPLLTMSLLGSLSAVRADILQTLTISVTTFTQQPINDNGTNNTAAAPKAQSHSTADLLKTLAKDANIAYGWPSNSFPSTAKLAVGNDGFVVINGTNVLVNVNGILSFENMSTNIVSGKMSDITGLANTSTKELQIGKITFDDTAIVGGGNLKFWIQGLITNTRTDTVPNASSSVYSETHTGKMTNGAGAGTDSDGSDFVLTGTVSVTGKATLQLVH